MMSDDFKLEQITLVGVNMSEMVRFYNEVLDTTLQPVEAYGTTLYRGNLAGIALLVCPNEVAQVQAQQNRHQFRFRITSDLEDLLTKVEVAGGKIEPENTIVEGNQRIVTVRDPDGNSIEFISVID